MSVDLILLPLRPGDGYEAGMALFNELEPGGSAPIDTPDDAREAAALLIATDPRYRPFERDFAAIARYEGITEQQAQARYDSIELNGAAANGDPLAQFLLHRNRILVHWYAGTTESEMRPLLVTLCRVTGFAIVDPQRGEVYHFDPSGSLAPGPLTE